MADDDHPTLDFEPPHPNGAVHQSGITRARAVRRRWFLIGGIALVAVWIFAIVWSVTVTSHSPERLDVPSAQAVAAKCAAAQHQLRALPNPSPIQGADRVLRIRSENDVLRRMVDAFAAVQPPASTPAAALKGWSADWTRVIDARARYANDLDDAAATPDKKIKFVLPASSGVKPVTDKMNDFVRENHPNLDACFTDALALEKVEGPREYKKVTA